MKDLRIKNIERKEKLAITVDGKQVDAFKGETILAALIAAGYKSLKKNPVSKEHRGALCGMGVCFECTVTVNGIPNIRACMTAVRDNMEIITNE